MISRRVLVFGGVALGLAGAVAVLATRMVNGVARHAASAMADYLAGRVVVRAGWIISETEAAAVPASAVIPIPPASEVQQSSEGG